MNAQVILDPLFVGGVQQAEPGQERQFSEFYYRKKEKDYLQIYPEGQIVPISQENVKAALVTEGRIPKAEFANPILYRIRAQHALDYDGPMPGYALGLHRENGLLFYCTSVPTLSVPRFTEGALGQNWPVTFELCRRLLSNDEVGGAQFWTFLAHLKMSIEGLKLALSPSPFGAVRSVRPGQAVALVGPIGCGKSFLLKHVIAPLLGGRLVGAFNAFSADAGGFNGELLLGEVWFVDDHQSSKDIRSRLCLAANIKANLYGAGVSFHLKHKTPITLTPYGRLFICCNDTEESLTVLPPIKDDILDKIHLFRCNATESPMPTETEEQRTLYRATVEAELPFMAGDLEKWEIYDEYRSGCSGVKTYMNPSVLASLRQQTPEATLIELILAAFDANQFSGAAWSGTARRLPLLLTDSDFAMRREAERLLLGWPKATGTYLGRIADHSEEYAEEFEIEVLRLGQGNGETGKGVTQYRLVDLRQKGGRNELLKSLWGEES